MNDTIATAVHPMREDLRLASLLGLAGAIATALLFPYLLAIMPDAFARLPFPLPAVIALQALQAFLLLTLLSFVGLRLAPGTGLTLPWLRAALARQPLPPFPWRLAATAGVGAGLAVVALAPLFAPFMPPMAQAPAANAGGNVLAGLLASFYGAIGEELQLRLFLMTLLVWLFATLGKRRPTAAVYWVAIGIAALLFGAGHLPAAAHVWPLDAVVVTRTIALNALAGIVFGWLYWRRGLEVAMAAHFCADLVLHVAAPLLAGAGT